MAVPPIHLSVISIMGDPYDPDPASIVPPELPLVAPDAVEQELGESIDNVVPTHGYRLAPMVGIGGSAGAIASLQAFFEKAPSNAGFVFVVILHLSPDHESIMPDLIQQWTPMPVAQPSDGEKVKPNSVYVIPPAKQLTVVDGHFRLADLPRERGRRMAVDLFFRSLADTHGAHAMAVVLSGGDGDGTLGIKRIKERGGLTIAQDPSEAEHDSMPRGAIETGMVDWVLKAADMPTRIAEYVARERRLVLPPEEAPPTPVAEGAAVDLESVLGDILLFVRTHTGRDFANYKRATVLRRISRRVQVNGLEDLPAYLSYLRTHPGEAGALVKDLLISVTNFFRDRDAWASLEKVIPRIFEGKTRPDAVRAWIPACATGEEAYSLAMLLIEHARTLEESPLLQIFGCDLDEDAVQTARAGLFPEAIIADVSAERVKRFFVKEPGGYRVRSEIRERVLFAHHDLLKDAPFSRLDIVSCRNLLIYLAPQAQDHVFETFHFALKPNGLLFLGTAESVGDGSALFHALDRKNRVYIRKSTPSSILPALPRPTTFARRIANGEERSPSAAPSPPSVILPDRRFFEVAPRSMGNPASAPPSRGDRPSWSELHFKLLDRVGPPSVLVDSNCDIQHISEAAGQFLQVMGGEPSSNLLRLVLPSLRIGLRAALFQAAQSGQPTESSAVPIELKGQTSVVDIRVAPAADLAPGFLLVTFDSRAAEGSQAMPAVLPADSVMHQLERELETVKAQLRETIEQYEINTEELKASNEEFQSMNEELRSATEELETSREELQSINEELTTVNHELKEKVDELAHSNSDLQNLMGATEIATVFLGRDMRVMRFTDSAAPIFNLIHADVGRPLQDLQHQIDYPEITADAALVLEKLTPVERHVTGACGKHYLVRMLPYRTAEDRIAGVVLTLIDITERHLAQEQLREKVDELSRFNAVAVGRETRMIELKKEINELCARLNEASRYPLAFEGASTNEKA